MTNMTFGEFFFKARHSKGEHTASEELTQKKTKPNMENVSKANTHKNMEKFRNKESIPYLDFFKKRNVTNFDTRNSRNYCCCFLAQGKRLLFEDSHDEELGGKLLRHLILFKQYDFQKYKIEA